MKRRVCTSCPLARRAASRAGASWRSFAAAAVWAISRHQVPSCMGPGRTAPRSEAGSRGRMTAMHARVSSAIRISCASMGEPCMACCMFMGVFNVMLMADESIEMLQSGYSWQRSPLRFPRALLPAGKRKAFTTRLRKEMRVPKTCSEFVCRHKSAALGDLWRCQSLAGQPAGHEARLRFAPCSLS